MSMSSENANAQAVFGASLIRAGNIDEALRAVGVFKAELYRDGQLLWRDEFPNVVATVGKNLALDTYLAGVAYTVTGPFMGLISSVGYTTGPVAADTMTSHGGWTEAGNANAPSYTAPRKTAVWAAASAGAKALSAALSFAITVGGTVKGAFLVYGTGAVSTIDNTGGVLYSAGLFTGGDRVVIAGDSLAVSYSTSL
jgi:hypothetical protein